MITVTEFSPSQEVLTATLHTTLETGESVVGPTHVGFYADGTEIWIEREGQRVGVEVEDLNAFIKQLRRAAKMSAAHGKEGA